MSTGSSQDLLLSKKKQGPRTGFHQDLRNIFSQGPLQDPGQDFFTKELQAKSQTPPLQPQRRNPTGQKQFPA